MKTATALGLRGGLFLDQFVNAFVSRVFTLCGIPIVKNLAKVGIGENWQAIDFLLRVSRQTFQQGFRSCVSQRAIVFPGRRDRNCNRSQLEDPDRIRRC